MLTVSTFCPLNCHLFVFPSLGFIHIWNSLVGNHKAQNKCAQSPSRDILFRAYLSLRWTSQLLSFVVQFFVRRCCYPISSPCSILPFSGVIRNGSPSIKLRMVEKLWNKISWIGCKWSNSNAPSTEIHVSHPFVGESLFLIFSSLG